MRRAYLFACAALALGGCPGADGPAGAQGDRGSAGEDGSGDLCWDKNGDAECNASVEDVDHSGKCDVRDCRGPAGAAGPAGVAGVAGGVGPVGPDGPQGPAGPEGLAGQQGLPGARGNMGAMGAVGPQGPQGPAGPKGARVALVAEYEFDEPAGSNSFADTGGLANAVTGNVTAGAGLAHAGKAVTFTGGEGVVAGDGNLIPDSAQIWPEMWVRANDVVGPYTLIEKTGGYRLRVQSGQLQWTVTTATGPCSVNHTSTMSANVWQHVSGWYDGLNAVVEIDGTQVSGPCNKGRLANTVGTQLTIGGRFTGGWTEVFRGNIDEVRVRGVAPFTAAEVTSGVKGVVFRWATFHTYQQSYGWWWGNQAGMNTLGLNPSTWTDGNGQVDQISFNKDWLRSVLVNKGTGGKNAVVVQDNFVYHSSTDAPVTVAMFRIRNTTNGAITWNPTFAITYYVSWDERASVALNGSLQWSSSGQNCNSWACQHNVAMSIPANRTSSVMFAALGGHPSSYRSHVLAIINDTAQLPDGLVFIDDFDTMTGDWSQ